MKPAAACAASLTALLDGVDASDAGAATLFERVRDLPFRFAPHRDPETLLATGGGACAPKHALLAHDGVLRGHAALQLRRGDAWLDVDATFDRPLAREGFLVHEDWDGRRSMPLVVVPVARVESTLGPDHEEALLGLRHRAGFPRAVVDQLNTWLESVRQAGA